MSFLICLKIIIAMACIISYLQIMKAIPSNLGFIFSRPTTVESDCQLLNVILTCTFLNLLIVISSPEKEAKEVREEREARPPQSRRLLSLVHPRLVCRWVMIHDMFLFFSLQNHLPLTIVTLNTSPPSLILLTTVPRWSCPPFLEDIRRKGPACRCHRRRLHISYFGIPNGWGTRIGR